MKECSLLASQRWLKDLAEGITSHELEALTLHGLLIVEAHKGFIRCKFIVPDCVSDENGNWHVGAMATLIDDVGAAAIYSSVGHVKATLEFNVSYFSTAKIQEEVEIEANVVGDKGRLASVLVEVRRSDNGHLVALGAAADIGLSSIAWFIYPHSKARP
ncbi:4HBT domain-containing protein [Cephalotus follicularis]|uniref:Acyl-coenzyme A thioesterase 13 n=1 Tax=Cephalotus follicularis TaxID=3775 RepID=A0A1Q3B9I6_CEPFO|nr:4HBT domain-containing protein [Cephalotus follicularis]